MTSADPNRQKLTQLRKLLIQHFSLDDLRVLCFDLGLEYEELPGDTRSTKMHGLIEYLQRRGELARLLEAVINYRPGVVWPSFEDGNLAAENDYSREVHSARIDLMLIREGRWPGERETLSTALRQFHELNYKREIGKYLWQFRIEFSDGKPYRSSPDRNEHTWLVVTGWNGEQWQRLTKEQKSGSWIRPYGKIFSTRVAKGWRVELRHEERSIDPEATKSLLEQLFQDLCKNGLQPTDQLKTAAPERSGLTSIASLTRPQVAELGKLVAEWFSEGELRYLSLYLSLDYDDLPGDNKLSKARELADHVRRNGNVPKLWKKLHEERPRVNWIQALI